MRSAPSLALASFITAALVGACGDSVSDDSGGDDSPSSKSDSGGGGSEFGLDDGGTPVGGEEPFIGDPKTCAEAAANHTYLGCDFVPTITMNAVWSIFDFAVAVANTSADEAEVKITGPMGTNQTVKIAPNSLQKIYLPWVPALKGGDFNPDPQTGGPSYTLSSVIVAKGAFRLTSSIPVSVYQFNALEYGPKGGPAGKSWSSCPAKNAPCFSYSNDASLLLPTTALTGNYRVSAYDNVSMLTITATVDNTTVHVGAGAASNGIAGGPAIAPAAVGASTTFKLNAGDVAVIMPTAPPGTMGGSQITADHPVQAISSNSCANTYRPTCDHIEESVLPAETLGKHYVVASPSHPSASTGQFVYFFGNVDNTTLSYFPKRPAGCPTTVDAGEVARCGGAATADYENDAKRLVVTDSFEVSGDHEFGLNTFLLGSAAVSNTNSGDPSQSVGISVEQFRTKYVFLAPDDYDTNFADVTIPPGTALTLDGVAVTQAATVISSGFSVVRITLGPGNNGAHVLEGDKPFGLQVIGYGQATSYQYPGGLNLKSIAPPPPPVN